MNLHFQLAFLALAIPIVLASALLRSVLPVMCGVIGMAVALLVAWPPIMFANSYWFEPTLGRHIPSFYFIGEYYSSLAWPYPVTVVIGLTLGAIVGFVRATVARAHGRRSAPESSDRAESRQSLRREVGTLLSVEQSEHSDPATPSPVFRRGSRWESLCGFVGLVGSVMTGVAVIGFPIGRHLIPFLVVVAATFAVSVRGIRRGVAWNRVLSTLCVVLLVFVCVLWAMTVVYFQRRPG